MFTKIVVLNGIITNSKYIDGIVIQVYFEGWSIFIQNVIIVCNASKAVAARDWLYREPHAWLQRLLFFSYHYILIEILSLI